MSFLAALLPGMIVNLLPRVDALNTVVTELISHQHSRPWLVASIMLKVGANLTRTFYSCPCILTDI